MTATAWVLFVLCFAPHGSEQQILDMFHISDLHLDSLYSVRGKPGEARCHEVNGSSSVGNLGPAGDYACDPPALLIESAFKYMNIVKTDPDFILWTGDSNPHWESGPDFEYIFSNLKNITKMLRKYFPNTVVIPALGNHDTDPPDQYPDYKVNSSLTFYDKYIEEGSFGEFIKGDARETFKKCGYYSVTPNSSYARIKFVVLNTNLYYANKQPLDRSDPCGQLKWLRDELVASDDDEQIFIIAHIPPGYYERDTSRQMFTVPNSDAYNVEFLRIFSNKTLAKKISAHFYGHTHSDAFRLFLDSMKVVRGVAFNTPSITPSLYLNSTVLGVNPGVRLYHYDVSARIMVDYEQHYLPLEEVSLAEQKPSSDRRERNGKFAGDSRSKRDDTNDDDDEKKESSPIALPKANRTIEQVESNVTAALNVTNQFGNESVTERVENVTVTSDVGGSKSTSVREEDDALDAIVKKWKNGYNATEAFNITNLSLKQMFLAYSKMKEDREGEVFRNYFKHNTLYHVAKDYQNCSRQCYTSFMCAIVKFTNEAMSSCLGTRTNATTNTVETTTSKKWSNGQKSTIKTTSSTSSYRPRPFSATTEQASSSPEVSSVPTNHSLRGMAIGFSIVMIVAIAVGGLFLYRRVQKNRYRSQEFLLTDSVFRYDGYSQVDSFT